MLEPILAEDSTCMKLVPSLEGILKDLKETATREDYIIALLIVLLYESGFHLPSHCHNSEPLRMPQDLKSENSGFYSMYFQLKCVPDLKCKLIAIPIGDTLILDFFPVMNEKKIYTMSIRILKYINPFSSDRCGRYMNLKEISHRFKDQLSTPVRSDVLMSVRMVGPSLLAIPIELKLKILGMLDVYSLTRVAQCCSEFHELCSEPKLWKNLLRRDFPGCSDEMMSSKDYYRLRFNRRKHQKVSVYRALTN